MASAIKIGVAKRHRDIDGIGSGRQHRCDGSTTVSGSTSAPSRVNVRRMHPLIPISLRLLSPLLTAILRDNGKKEAWLKGKIDSIWLIFLVAMAIADGGRLRIRG